MPRFFSIIVPAHNEEQLIEQTLNALQHIQYPKERYEVIVVENGSTDDTYAKARQFESAGFAIFSTSEKGVSRARNFGLERASPLRDWSIIVDADTFLKKDFLNELNIFLNRHPDVSYGMAALTPAPDTPHNRFWFAFRNGRDRLLKTLDTIHIVRHDLAGAVRYLEDFNFTEDLQYAQQLRKQGTYFFMPTKSVVSSARRYEKQGHWYVFFKDLFIGLMYTFWPSALKNRPWDPVR